MSVDIDTAELEVVEFDEDFAECMSVANDALPAAIRDSSYPFTVAGTIGLMASADSLKLGIIRLAQSENLYGTSVLYRSVIEHFVRFQYLFFRWVEERSDEPGREYDLFSKLSESLATADAVILSERLKGHEIAAEPLEILKQRGEAPEGVSKRQIQAITARWKYRNIIRYITDNQNAASLRGSPLLAHMIPIYAELSSFVHGGKGAEQSVSKLMDSTEDVGLAWEHAKWGSILANSLKPHFFLILGQDTAPFLEHFKALDARFRAYLADDT